MCQSCYPKPKDDASTWVKEYVELALSLILFFITWGFGIPAIHHFNNHLPGHLHHWEFLAGNHHVPVLLPPLMGGEAKVDSTDFQGVPATWATEAVLFHQ